MGETVIFAGYLRKSPPEKKLSMSTWHKRYFVLRENKHLEYFKNDKEKKPIKEPIDLHHCKSVEAGLYHRSFKHVFSIKTSERLYYLVAESQDGMETWVEKLCKTCDFTKLERNSPDISGKRQSATYRRSPPSISPVGLSSSYSASRMSGLSAASPTGFCPVHSFPGLEVKPRSSSDPPDPVVTGSMTLPPRRNMSLLPDIALAQISSFSFLSGCYDTVPTPRPASQDVYDVVPPPREDPSYDTVPPPRPDGHGSSVGDYDRLPSPRLQTWSPSLLSSDRSSDVYDFVPRPQSCVDQDDYDVPPLRQSTSTGRFDSAISDDNPNHRTREKQEMYDVLPPPRGVVSDQETYDVVPPPRGVGSNQDTYDVVPAPRGIIPDQDTYDVVPPPRGVVSDQETYDVLPPPRGVVSDQETYDVLPPPRGVVSDQEIYDVLPPPRGVYVSDQETYDVLPPPRGVFSDQETYDVLPPPRGVVSDQETYDVLPARRPASQDLYDIVPHPRRSSSQSSDTYDTLPRPVSTPEQYGGSPRALLKDPPQEIYDIVPPPKPSPYRGNVYDVVPSPRNLPLDSFGNSISNQCPLNSREGGYNQRLPNVPSEELRDSGVYGSGDIYQYPANFSAEGHEIRQHLSEKQGSPPVNRFTKPPPEINRKSKPVFPKDHSYCNMPPPVNRGTKPRQPPPNTNSYENYPNRVMHASIQRNQSLPLDAPHQNDHVNTSDSTDESYCHMAPRRLETTRCYSLSKKSSVQPDESYEEMASLQNINGNCSSSSSSSSLCLEDGEDTYAVMDSPDTFKAPAKPRDKKKKDLQYAEVQIVERGPRNRHLHHERPNTQYTFISEESTNALRQACNARKEHMNN